MRTFLTLLLTLLTIATSSAQTQQHSIEIDASSFTPVQTDALSGVAIDKIGKDHSQRECARIKMRMNRMTAAEIGELSVRPRGGNVEVMKCVVAGEGNGLIIELTAKEPTRFYLSHPKHGDSNEVSLNLAGGKEYTLSAELNVVYPIFVNTNIIGAEVYIDDVYVGSTNSNYTLMAKEVKPGRHKLRLQHGSSSTEREIEVTSDNLDFRIEINTATSRPQYVIFEVMPKNASVVIDQKSFAPKDGIVTTTLNNGSYSYVISAKDYHEERGTFVVNGAKVDKVIELSPAFGWVSIAGLGTLSNADIYIDDNHVGKTPVTSYKLPSGTHRVKIVKELYLPYEEDILIKDNEVLKFEPKLTADFAIVTLTTDKDADIYIDNTLMGRGTWTGNLASGAHIFEARKQGHRTTVLTQTIATTPQNQSYNLGSPTPIMGILDITSLPAKADVYVDNKLVGQTPIMVELIIGQHSVSVRKEGYRNSKSTTINIAEDEVCNMDVTLEKGKTYGDVRITGRPITANVTINGEDRGTTPLNTKLESGTYTVKLSAKGYKPYTKELEITEAQSYFVDGLLEERQGGFNVGLYYDMGVFRTPFYDYASNEKAYAQFGVGCGLTWRLWQHNSTVIPTIGVRYMRACQNFYYPGVNNVAFPVIVNINWLFGASDVSLYSGVGAEPAYFNIKDSNYIAHHWDCPLVFNLLGVGGRHCDFNIYLNCSVKTKYLATGMRLSFLF